MPLIAKEQKKLILDDNYIPIKEVAQDPRIKKHPQTLKKWIKDHKIKIRAGKDQKGHWVIHKNDIQKIEEYIKSFTPVR